MSSADNKWFGFWKSEDDGDIHLPPLESWIDPAWRPADRTELVSYLEECPVVVAASTLRAPCPVCGQLLSSSNFQSDGVWLWPQDLKHYILEHLVKIPEKLADHIRANDYRAPDSVNVEIERLPWP